MSSFLYKVIEAAASVLSGKQYYSLTPSKLELFLKENNGKQNFEPPRYIMNNFSVQRESFPDCPCWIISPRKAENSAQKMALFVHGGGFLFGMHAIHWRAVAKIVKRLAIPVWVPLYPLLPQKTIEQMSFIIADVYRRALKNYSAQNITVVGDSAGAHLTLVLCHHIGLKKIPAPMPQKIILVSPGTLDNKDPEIAAAMKKTEKYDKLLSYSFVDSMIKTLKIDASEGDYLFAPFQGDFSRYVQETGFPHVCVFSGTHDIFFPQVPPFVERLNKAGVTCEFVRGEGMMHVWAYMPTAPESIAALERLCDFIALG